MSSEALNPEPVTELPLTPPAEDDEEDAAIAFKIVKTLKSSRALLNQHAYSTDKLTLQGG